MATKAFSVEVSATLDPHSLVSEAMLFVRPPLPEALTGDPDKLAKFLAEAKQPVPANLSAVIDEVGRSYDGRATTIDVSVSGGAREGEQRVREHTAYYRDLADRVGSLANKHWQ